jgi:hypothetical protein
MEEVFTNIYEKLLWGDNCNPEYNGSSGGGSDVDFNKDTYIPFLHLFTFQTPILINNFINNKIIINLDIAKNDSASSLPIVGQ